MIPTVLAARFLSVGLPIWAMSRRAPFAAGTVRVLTWGGLRGGISVALALSIPMSAEKNLIVTMTYFVCAFSILVQGLTLERVARRFQLPGAAPGPAGEPHDSEPRAAH